MVLLHDFVELDAGSKKPASLESKFKRAVELILSVGFNSSHSFLFCPLRPQSVLIKLHSYSGNK